MASITSQVMETPRTTSYHRTMSASQNIFGPLLREWRQRRRISQLELALDGNISTRHLSFLETGRARPSRDMVLHLAEQLAVPLRDRNTLLSAAGFAPVFGERGLEDPALAVARQAVELVIQGHAPYPAVAVDRHWTMVAANDAVPPLLTGVDAALLRPPVNVMRLALHPAGLAPRIVNLPEWRTHLLDRLRTWVALRLELSPHPCHCALATRRALPALNETVPARDRKKRDSPSP
jgi:transcriptional regulator with XRE-family HTH domain